MPRYFSERGKTHEEVLDRIQKKYGDKARILMQKNVPGTGIFGLFGKETVEYTGYVATGIEGREVQKAKDNQTRAAILAAAGKKPEISVASPDTPPTAVDSEGSDTMNEVLHELRELKGRLAIGASTPPPEPFPVLTELSDILRDNDFDDEYIQSLLDSMRKVHSAADLDDRGKVHESAAEYIANGLGYYHADQESGPRVFILVGPTGVGKTTTIAKLAAVNGLAGDAKDVRIITVDSFRIGARAQVETYGEIMGIPVTAVDDYDDLRKHMALSSEADLILVDTIGKSPRDVVKIDEMRKLLTACGENSEVHLALSATTKTADLREILEQFEPFGYRSVVLTKLDETTRVGNIISLLSGTGNPVSFFTDGQSVPVDISVAAPSRLLPRIKGLDFDQVLFEKRYPAVDLTAAWR